MRTTIDIPAPLIATIGRALYGDEWQRALSRALDVQERRVRRWAEAARAGEVQRLPRSLLEELAGLIEANMREAGDALADLRARLT